MKIIALVGEGNTGKSTTLRELIRILEREDWNVQDRHRFPHRDGSAPDETVLFERGGLRIGITTYGDTRDLLEHALARIGTCDVFVCATRTKGETCEFVKEKSQGDILIEHGEWSYDSNSPNTTLLALRREQVNRMQAYMIRADII